MKIQVINIHTGNGYDIEQSKPTGEMQMTCPACSADRKKKRDKCLQWNADKGVGLCHHCDASFIKKTSFKHRAQKEYKLPEWGNKTALTDKAVRWFEGRMISQKTLQTMGISSQTDGNHNWVCFPYFRGEQLVNCKYRDGAKNFRLEAGAELLFYNFNTIVANKELIITEGEMDALSFIEVGFQNVVSVPNGAGCKALEYLDNYIDELAHVDKFYIASDFDAKGLELRDELVRRLGSDKCSIVTYQGFKDANELLIGKGGVALREAVKNAQELPLEAVVDLNGQYDAIFDYYQRGLPPGYGLGVAAFDSLCRWDTGLIIPVTGVPSHGKSEILDFIVTRLNVMHGWKVAYFSPENNPVTLHYSKVATKIAGTFMREYKTPKEVFDRTFDYIEQNFFWIDPDQNAKASDLLRQVEQLIKRKGVKILVLDPFNCIDLEQGKMNKSETETQAIGRFLYELQRFARKNKILIFIVAHPAKPMQPQRMKGSDEKKYPIVTLYDIAGSAHWYNRADIGLVVHRDFVNGSTTFIVQKIRFQNLGRTGDLLLQYNQNNGRFHIPFDPDNTDWLNPQNTEAGLDEAIESMYNDKYECPF